MIERAFEIDDDLPTIDLPFRSGQASAKKNDGGAPALKATPFVWRNPHLIPPRRFLYGRHIARGFVSVCSKGATARCSTMNWSNFY